MQEEIEQKSAALMINGTKFSLRTLKSAALRLLAHRQNPSAPSVKHRGKQTVSQLVGQNQGVSNIEITDSNIKAFERVARKYGVDYAVKKDHSVSPPKYLVFFKARDTDAQTSAFTEFTAKQVQQKSKPSIVAQIRKLADIVRAKSQDKVKNKEMGREL